MTEKENNIEPLIFEVSDTGQLSIADYLAPETRMDAYEFLWILIILMDSHLF